MVVRAWRTAQNLIINIRTMRASLQYRDTCGPHHNTKMHHTKVPSTANSSIKITHCFQIDPYDRHEQESRGGLTHVCTCLLYCTSLSMIRPFPPRPCGVFQPLRWERFGHLLYGGSLRHAPRERNASGFILRIDALRYDDRCGIAGSLDRHPAFQGGHFAKEAFDFFGHHPRLPVTSGGRLSRRTECFEWTYLHGICATCIYTTWKQTRYGCSLDVAIGVSSHQQRPGSRERERES